MTFAEKCEPKQSCHYRSLREGLNEQGLTLRKEKLQKLIVNYNYSK